MKKREMEKRLLLWKENSSKTSPECIFLFSSLVPSPFQDVRISPNTRKYADEDAHTFPSRPRATQSANFAKFALIISHVVQTSEFLRETKMRRGAFRLLSIDYRKIVAKSDFSGYLFLGSPSLSLPAMPEHIHTLSILPFASSDVQTHSIFYQREEKKKRNLIRSIMHIHDGNYQ